MSDEEMDTTGPVDEIEDHVDGDSLAENNSAEDLEEENGEDDEQYPGTSKDQSKSLKSKKKKGIGRAKEVLPDPLSNSTDNICASLGATNVDEIEDHVDGDSFAENKSAEDLEEENGEDDEQYPGTSKDQSKSSKSKKKKGIGRAKEVLPDPLSNSTDNICASLGATNVDEIEDHIIIPNECIADICNFMKSSELDKLALASNRLKEYIVKRIIIIRTMRHSVHLFNRIIINFQFLPTVDKLEMAEICDSTHKTDSVALLIETLDFDQLFRLIGDDKFEAFENNTKAKIRHRIKLLYDAVLH